MPLNDIQERYRELGRIRMGARRDANNPKSAPMKLDKWRLTCHDRRLLDNAAVVYGGEVREWKNAPVDGENYELFTDTDALDIVVPPGYLLSQDYELWAGSGCKRRCDGETQKGNLRPCQCPADLAERMAMAKDGKACTPATRLSVMLPVIPDLGVWRLESHGYYAATELQASYKVLQIATLKGSYVRAQLRIEKREAKRPSEKDPEKFETRKFNVPVIAFEGNLLEIATELGEDARGQLPNVTMPPTEGRALPAGRPELSSARGEHDGIEAPDLPQTPLPGQDLGLPKWLVDMPGDDGTIIDIAMQVAAESGVTIEMRSLVDVAKNARTEKAQAEIRRRVEEFLGEGPEGAEADWGTPVQEPLG